MQLNYSIPDVALVELILYLAPRQLLSLAQGKPTGVQIVDDNLESVCNLLKSKEVLGRLCSTYYDGTTRHDTFEDYLLGYDYWHLDQSDIDYQWFEKRWKLTLNVKRVLYLAARNAEKDIRFLTIVDKVLKEHYLSCSEEHVYLVCRGLIWSPELQKKYLAPLIAYRQIHDPASAIAKEEDLIKYWKDPQ